MHDTDTKTLTAQVPAALADRVDDMARQRDRTRQSVMQEALAAWVTQEAQRDQLTREALADVDAGDVLDHAAVLRWAQGLRANPH